jgi:bifunctional DNA-binding transcriptional regulator/antitoxin component of YhaV-PrlF toxin-antitoxin module
MTEITEFDTKLGAEGRVVIPAEVRRMLGVEIGGRLLIVVDGPDIQNKSGPIIKAVMVATPQSIFASSVSKTFLLPKIVGIGLKRQLAPIREAKNRFLQTCWKVSDLIRDPDRP